jgi:hypothetical protein
MNELLVGIGNALIALSGVVVIFVEYFRPSLRERAKRYRQLDTELALDEARDEAESAKRREISLFFLPWFAGFLVIAVGLISC